jgi:hypothetical protein
MNYNCDFWTRDCHVGSLLSFAIYSASSSIIKDRSVFSGGGAVGSNGYVEVVQMQMYKVIMFPVAIFTLRIMLKFMKRFCKWNSNISGWC